MMRNLLLALLAAGAACSSGPPQPQTSFNMKVTVPAGAELHDCQFVTMPAYDTYVTAAQHHYTPGSHHMLLFRTDLATIPVGQESIQDCYEGGNGTIMSHVRGVVYGSMETQGSMQMPAGVGLHLGAQEVLLLQVHYLNASPSAVDANVNVGLFTTTDASKITTLASILFFYDPFIDVPPMAKAVAHAECVLPKDITLFSVTPHYHARGYGYEAYLDPPSQPPSAMPFYTSTDWEHPNRWTGGQMPLAAGTHVRWQCDYDNTAGSLEYFQGQSAAKNEMCMFTGLYYPAMDVTSDLCERNMTGFGSGTQTCSQTISCVQACPAADAPMGMGGSFTVGPCWQKCVTQSCPKASTPFLAQVICIGAKCKAECSGSGANCAACAIQNCANEVSACGMATCN